MPAYRRVAAVGSLGAGAALGSGAAAFGAGAGGGAGAAAFGEGGGPGAAQWSPRNFRAWRPATKPNHNQNKQQQPKQLNPKQSQLQPKQTTATTKTATTTTTTKTTTRSSSRELRISWYSFCFSCSVFYFSGGTLPQKKVKGQYWET